MDPLLSDVLFGILAVILGTVATLALYWLLNKLVQLLPLKTQDKVKSLGFLIPAATLLILVLLLPLLQTFVWSFMDDKAKAFVGLENYTTLFTSPDFLSILLNNFLWILFVPAVTVSLGILFANLGNQVGPTREKF